MNEENDINSRLERIERDLSWIIQYLLKRDQPIQPPPYIPNPYPTIPTIPTTPPTIPNWPNKVYCPKCGMEWSGVMGYVCMDQSCPIQMKVTC